MQQKTAFEIRCSNVALLHAGNSMGTREELAIVMWQHPLLRTKEVTKTFSPFPYFLPHHLFGSMGQDS